MTQTTSPSLGKDSGLIKFNFDGLFHDKKQIKESAIHPYFPDLSKSHREQLWVHQNTFNSLIESAHKDYLPMTLDN